MYHTAMTMTHANQRATLTLLHDGYSIEAVACRLGLSIGSIRAIMLDHGQKFISDPEGYSTLRAEAKRVGLTYSTLHRAVICKQLPVILSCGHRYVKPELVDLWLAERERSNRAKCLGGPALRKPSP
jgi:hypothetical protein